MLRGATVNYRLGGDRIPVIRLLVRSNAVRERKLEILLLRAKFLITTKYKANNNEDEGKRGIDR